MDGRTLDVRGLWILMLRTKFTVIQKFSSWGPHSLPLPRLPPPPIIPLIRWRNASQNTTTAPTQIELDIAYS